jgi:hypothetical protein
MMTAADYAALEARVAELEQQVRHMLPAKIDAVGYGVGLVHADTQYIRETQDIHTAALGRMESRLDRHGEMLGEILRRLPGGAINGPSGGPDDH